MNVSFGSALCCNLWIDASHIPGSDIKLIMYCRDYFVKFFASSDIAPGGNARRLGCSFIINLIRDLQGVEMYSSESVSIALQSY